MSTQTKLTQIKLQGSITMSILTVQTFLSEIDEDLAEPLEIHGGRELALIDSERIITDLVVYICT